MRRQQEPWAPPKHGGYHGRLYDPCDLAIENLVAEIEREVGHFDAPRRAAITRAVETTMFDAALVKRRRSFEK